MLKCGDIADSFQEISPESLAEDFDNVGLLIGHREQEVKKVLLTLDVDEGVAKEAVKLGADMIVSHHPVIFHPLKRIESSTANGRMLLTLIEHHIAVYSAHTNMDAAWGGLNDFLLEKLDMKSDEVLEEGKEEVGIGRIVYIKDGVTVGDLAKKVKEAFSLSEIRYTGDANKAVHTIGVCSGGGSGMIDDCISRQCDVFLTGDIKYTGARHLAEYGISVIDLGHYESEHICMEMFEKMLREKFGERLELFLSKENKNIFSTL